MRSTVIKNTTDDEGSFFTFYEDGTYTRSWDSDMMPKPIWKVIDDQLHYKGSGRIEEVEWQYFYGDLSEDQECITKAVIEWTRELDFYDALEQKLSVSDPKST